MAKHPKTVALIGARGYVGRELLSLLAGHADFEVTAVSSRELAGQAVKDHIADWPSDLGFEDISPAVLADRAFDVVVLALPNGAAAPYVAAVEKSAPSTVVVDLSADYRFDDSWTYGLPELNREALDGATRIANPGCYATAMMLALLPIREMLSTPPECFGVSGYSGAGTTPSRKNDVAALKDNLMPYALTGHLHEREVSRHLGRDVHFTPHVAAFFRGISMTSSVMLDAAVDVKWIADLYRAKYEGEPLVQVVDGIPEVRDGQGRHGCRIGGFATAEDGKRLVVVSVLDNLLKGAATQALQNMNLAVGFDEYSGIPQDRA